MTHSPPTPLYRNRRMGGLVLLGFASGLPGIWSLLGPPLQAWLGQMNVDIVTIGRFSLVALPFSLNFAWAPLLDRFMPPGLSRWGRRRSWLLVIQSLLILSLIALAVLGPDPKNQSLTPMFLAAMLVAFFAATQDVVADAYRTDVLKDHELGAGAAVFVNGYRVGMAIGAGGCLMLSSYLGWRLAYTLMAGLMGLGLLGTWISPIPPNATQRPTHTLHAFTKPLIDFFSRHGWQSLVILLFVVLFKMPDATARVMVTPLLQKQLGLSVQTIGLLQSWLGIALTMVGAMLGGILVARMGFMHALWPLALLQMFSNLGFCFLAQGHDSTFSVAIVIGIEAICGGMVTVGFIAFLMAQCNRRYSATQYALFTSLNSVTGTLAGAFTGNLVHALGYGWFFALTALTGIPALILLAILTAFNPRQTTTTT